MSCCDWYLKVWFSPEAEGIPRFPGGKLYRFCNDRGTLLKEQSRENLMWLRNGEHVSMNIYLVQREYQRFCKALFYWSYSSGQYFYSCLKKNTLTRPAIEKKVCASKNRSSDSPTLLLPSWFTCYSILLLSLNLESI